jgi:large subunit ribosomal protein L1
MRRSKRYRALQEKVTQATYDLKSAIEMVKQLSTAKFDETVELAIGLGLDPRKEHVRGTVSLPHGTGKTKRVLVLAEGEKAEEGRRAGADFVGSDEYLKQIEKGWLEFDAVIATPELMPKISKLGKILGPRGLMPNPKTGTLTNEIEKTVKEIKKGKIEFKMDRTGCLHSPVGKVSFSNEKLQENIVELLKAVKDVKPPSIKEKAYLKTIHISSTMGVGLKLDPKNIEEILSGKKKRDS